MDIDLSAFHFLRPLWLLLILPGVLLPLLWLRRIDLKRQLHGIIAPHLMEHLVITPEDHQRLRPVHLLGVLLVLGGVAAAGPTWKQDIPDFLDNRAPLVLAVDLSPSMDADDMPPTRLEATKHKLHDLIQRRAGSRTALIAYAGGAHLVLPATEDPALLDTFVQALATGLIAKPGKDALGAIEEARKLLDAEKTPGTLMLVTDGADASQFDAIGKSLSSSKSFTGSDLQVLVLAVGGTAGGSAADDSAAGFDQKALKGLADAADAPLGSMTLNDDDLDWIELHAQKHFQAVQGDGQQIHWKDAGYWLCWPLALLALCCVRRGWQVQWAAAVLLTVLLGSAPATARAGVFADAFFTPDQQGRWAFEHQHYPQAAAHFTDPYWKGLAAYQAADYDAALASFAKVDTASAYFYMGNTYVRLSRFPEAIAIYQQALALQPEFPEATANLALATALQKDHEDQQKAGAPDEKPDKVVYDKKGQEGKAVPQTGKKTVSDDLWLSNLTTSPANFLKQKFLIQDAARQANSGKANAGDAP